MEGVPRAICNLSHRPKPLLKPGIGLIAHPEWLVVPLATLFAFSIVQMLMHQIYPFGGGRNLLTLPLRPHPKRDFVLDILIAGGLCFYFFDDPTPLGQLFEPFQNPDNARAWIMMNFIAYAIFALGVKQNRGALSGWPAPDVEDQHDLQSRRSTAKELKAHLARILTRSRQQRACRRFSRAVHRRCGICLATSRTGSFHRLRTCPAWT